MKKRLISLALALNVIFNLAACSKEEHNETSTNNVSVTDLNTDNDTTQINAKDVDINSFITNINQYNIPYAYNEYYPNEEDIKEYLMKEIDIPKHTDDDYTNIFDCIKNNTIKKYQNSIIFNDDELLSSYEKEIKQNTQIALKKALNNIFENATNDILEDICQLKSTSIVIADLSNNPKKPTGN